MTQQCLETLRLIEQIDAIGPSEAPVSRLKESVARLDRDLRRRADEAEDRFRMAVDAAEVGVWDWEVDTGAVTWNDHHTRIFCGPGAAVAKKDYEAAIRCVHPDDREAVARWICTARYERGPFDHEFRVVWPDGRVRWVHSKGRFVFGDDGRAVRMTGTVVDVTERRHLDAARREAEQFGRTLMDGSTDCVKVLSTDGRLLQMNSSGLCLMELEDLRPLVDARWAALWPEGMRPKVIDAVERARAGAVARFEGPCPTATGRQRWWDVTVAPVRDDADGPVVRLLAVSRDVTAAREAVEGLRSSEERFRALVEAAAQVVWTTDGEGRTSEDSPSWRAFTGQTREQCAGWGWLEAVHPDDRDRTAAEWRRCLRAKCLYETEYRLRHRTGGHRWTVARGVPLLRPDGSIRGWVGMNTDVTERRAAEEALRDSEAVARDRYAELEQVYRFAPVGLFTLDRQFHYVRINERMAEMNGLPAERHRGLSVDDVVPDLAAPLRDLYRPVLERGEPRLEVELHGETPKAPGVQRDWLASYFPLRSGDGEVTGLIGAVLEVTDRKRAELSLARHAERQSLLLGVTRGLIAARPDPAALAEVVFRLAGPALDADMCVNYRYDAAAPAMVLVAGFGLPADLAPALTRLEPGAGFCGEVAATSRQVCVDAGRIACDPRAALLRQLGVRAYACNPLLSRDGQVLGTFAVASTRRDAFLPEEAEFLQTVTHFMSLALERASAEAALRSSEARFRLLADAMPQMVWVTRADGHHEYFNRRWYEFTGVPEGSTDGEGWAGVFHPDDQPRAWARWRHSLATGEPYEVEYRLRHRSGEYRWALGRALPVRDEAGRVERWFGTCTDIHDAKLAQAELAASKAAAEAAREAAEHANKAKDRFLAVLSHELRTPLAPVLLAVAALEHDPSLPGGVRDELSMVRRNVELEARLIDDLLDLSRVLSGKLRTERRPLRLHDVVRHAVETCAAAAAEKAITLRVDLAAERDGVVGDAARLQQVVWNLLSNAVKFTPAGGAVAVRSEVGEGGASVRLSVADNGVGIPRQALGRVFEPFVQVGPPTSGGPGGLGLGLAICKGIVSLHGGTIGALSDGPGGGATFSLELPLVTAAPTLEEDAPAEAAHVPGPLPSLRILLVEDHPDTARTLARLLRGRGHRVVVGHSVAEGLAAAASEGPFDLLLCDVGLPDGSGNDLMRRLKDAHGLRGIAMSGYGMEDDLRLGREAGFAEYLVKPVNVNALEEAVRRAIGRRDEG